MKKLTVMLAGAMFMICGMLAVASSASALTVNAGTTQVGGADTVIDGTNILPNAASEKAWITQVLTTYLNQAFVVTSYNVFTAADAGVWNWQLTNQALTYAMSTPTAPEYFLIKTGNIVGGAGNREYLFDNMASLNWAVVNLNDIAIEDIASISAVNIGKFSQIGEVNGSAPVPEPGTMMLLGAGFLGLAVYGKRRKNA